MKILILVSQDFWINGPNLPVNTDLISLVAAVYRTITNKDLEETCQSLIPISGGKWQISSLSNIWIFKLIILLKSLRYESQSMSDKSVLNLCLLLSGKQLPLKKSSQYLQVNLDHWCENPGRPKLVFSLEELPDFFS